MASTFKTWRKPKTNGLKRLSSNRPARTTPILITGGVTAGSVLTVTFDQVVSLSGVPQYAVDVMGVTPVSATLTSPTQVAITYSATIMSATTVTIPYEEPAVRNASGGFVATSLVPLA
jgi:hypothetical protein